MKFFQVMAFEEAKSLITKNIPAKLLQSQTLPIALCMGKVVAKNTVSCEELPNYNRSTVDGYAVKAEDVYTASEGIPSILTVIGRVDIGQMPQITLESGQAVEISTGAVLPKNCNAVAMVEHTERLGDKVAIYQCLKVRENTVIRGEDLNINDIIVKKGQTITPMLLGVLAGVGVSKVEVYVAPKVTIISTGDELVEIEQKAENGKIRDINTTVLSAMACQQGWEVVEKVLIKDDLTVLTNALKKATSSSDIVLVSGGSSVGNADYTKTAMQSMGQILLHGIAIKPGKPTIVATVNDSLVFGLAGHPLAAALCFKVLVNNPLKVARGQAILPDYFVTANESFHSTPGRTNIQPVTLINTNDGVVVQPIYVKSAYIARASRADGYIILPEKCEGISKGDKVEVYKL